MRAVLDDRAALPTPRALVSRGRRRIRAEAAFKAQPPGFLYLMTEYDAESAKTGLTAQNFGKRPAEPRRRGRHPYAGSLHGGNLGFGIPTAARDDGACMPHAAARRGGAAGNEAHHRLAAAALGFIGHELGGILLGRPADLTDHDDRFGGLIGEEHFQHLDELGALDRIAPDADRGGLPKPFPGGLEYRLVGQRAGTRHDPDLAGLEDVARHDADLALARRHHARTVGPDQPRSRTRQRTLDLHHVEHRDALGDADHERDL